jgi:hypothetical protein
MINHVQTAFQVLLAAHGVSLAIVNLTATPKDNEVHAKVYKVIEKLAGFISPLAKR